MMKTKITRTVDDKINSNSNWFPNAENQQQNTNAVLIDNRSTTIMQRKLNEVVNQNTNRKQDSIQRKINTQLKEDSSSPIQKQEEIRKVNVEEISRMKESLSKILKDLGDEGKPYIEAKLALTELKIKQNKSFDQDHVHKFAGILNDARNYWKIKFDQKECPY